MLLVPVLSVLLATSGRHRLKKASEVAYVLFSGCSAFSSQFHGARVMRRNDKDSAMDKPWQLCSEAAAKAGDHSMPCVWHPLALPFSHFRSAV